MPDIFMKSYLVGFFVEYRDSSGNLRYYYPDFIINTEDTHFVLETKGREDVDVEFKDKRIVVWRRLKEGWLKVGVNLSLSTNICCRI